MSRISALALAFCLVPELAPEAQAAPAAPDAALSAEARAGEAEVAAAIRSQLASMERWRGADIRVELAAEVKSADLPAAGESLRIAPEGLKIGRRNVIAPVEVLRDGRPVRSFWVPATVHVKAVAVTAARKIAAGETLSAADVRESVMETADLGADWATSAGDVLGKTARRGFAAGDLLPASEFVQPLLVKRGDTVALRLQRGGIVLESSARALEDGRMGEVVKVRGMDSSSVLRARVSGPAAVAMQ